MTMDTLYHYTSSSAFVEIIKNNSIWLSDLSLSNDYKEGKIVMETVDRLLDDANLKTNQKEFIKDALMSLENNFSCYGFCLSQNPDQLSQWRGYADDGSGFSIGFSRKYLYELTAIAYEDGPSGIELCEVI